MITGISLIDRPTASKSKRTTALFKLSLYIFNKPDYYFNYSKFLIWLILKITEMCI